MAWFHGTALGQALLRNRSASERRRHSTARLIDATMINIDTSRRAAHSMHEVADRVDDDGLVKALRRLEKDIGHK